MDLRVFRCGLLRAENPVQHVTQFSCFLIVDGNHQPAATLEWNTKYDYPTFAHCFHGPVTGPRFHCRHDASLLNRWSNIYYPLVWGFSEIEASASVA